MSQTPPSCGPIEVRHQTGSAIVSIQTSSSSLAPTVEVGTEDGAVAASAGTSIPNNIVIHEFIDETSTNDRQQRPSQSLQEHHHHHHHHHLPHPGGGSITIMTPPTPTCSTSAVSRINICIRNHFPMPLIEPKPKAQPRRHHEQFGLSDDVLVRIENDDRYYLGTIIAIAEHSCLVHFDDGTERWSAFEEITKLGTSGNDIAGNGSSDRNRPKPKATCVMCKEHKPQQTVEICERCRRGYHRQCLSPQSVQGQNGCAADASRESGPWLCCRCIKQSASPKPTHSEVVVNRFQGTGLSEQLAPLMHKEQLSYDLDKLEWDEQHHQNSEDKYCYCGEFGYWESEMLQCCRCRQWFHDKCIRSLQFPLYRGDKLYIFLCSICNHGHEFVRRLEISYTDLVHVVLYNMIAHHGRRFYDVLSAILPYIEENLQTLQVPDQFANMSSIARGDVLETALKAERKLFMNGREVNKRASGWTLRTYQAPRNITVDIPGGEIVTENMLQKLVANAQLVRFLPRTYLEKNFFTDAANRERMTGMKYSMYPYSEADSRKDLDSFMSMSSTNPSVTGTGSANTATMSDGIMRRKRGRHARINKDVAAKTAINGVAGTVNLSGGASGSTMATMPRYFSGNKRKYRGGYSQAWLRNLEAASDSNKLPRTSLDNLFPPPPNFIGENNPFYDTNPVTVPQPRKARVVKRRLGAKDISNPGKKRKLNQHKCAVGGASLQGPSDIVSYNTALAPKPNPTGRSVTYSATADTTMPKKNTVKSKTNSQSRRLRPRASTNYSETRPYQRRGSRAGSTQQQTGSDLDGIDYSSGYEQPVRPTSSLSSIDTIGSSSISTFIWDRDPVSYLNQEQLRAEIAEDGPSQAQQPPQPQGQVPQPESNGPLQTPSRPIRTRGIVRCIRTFRNGRQEYLLEYV